MWTKQPISAAPQPSLSTGGTKPADILVIIPAYNEAGAIRQVVNRIRSLLPTADTLVIDDGSADATAREAQAAGAFVVRHPFNLGIGGAVQTGLKFAQRHNYDYVIRMDGDGQHAAAEICHFLKALQTHAADMVFGSRFLGTDLAWHIPLSRRLGIRLYTWQVTLLTGRTMTDPTSGFWGMNRRATQVLATYLPQDFPDVESHIIVHKAGLKQMEIPVHMQARSTGVSSINLAQSIYYAFKVTLAVITTALKEIK